MNKEQKIKQLPKDWKWVKLGEVCKLKNGFAFKSTDYKSEGIPVLRISDIKFGSVKPDKSVRVDSRKDYEEYLVEEDDILVAMSGATTGKFGIFKNNEKAYQNQRVGKFKILNRVNLDNQFLLYQLHALKRQIEKDAYGGAQPNISSSKIEAMEIFLPPLATQLAIVSKIEELFSELDKGIENLRTAQQQLKTYRQAVLKHAFEGKLTEAWRRDTVSRVRIPSSLQKLSMAAEEQAEYGSSELPEGWKWVKTKDVIEIINNGYTPTKEYLFEGSGEVPFIKVYNLNFNGTLNFKKNPTFIPYATHRKDLKRSICLPGDVLINIVGPPLGKVSVVTNEFPEWNINQAIVMFRPNEKVISKYISYFMQNPVTINWLENTSKATAGQWNVKVSTCREIPFPVCSVIEQQAIVDEIESRLSVADKMEESINHSLQQAEALRQSILKRAFEGKLV